MYKREQLLKYDYFKQALDGRRVTDVLDPLTGLVSRAHMIAFVKSLMENDIPFTFGMIDLDNFKYINDSYGHSIGDKVLQGVAEELQKILGDFGIGGRFGGDEFLFINFRDLEYDDKKRFCNDLFRNNTVLMKIYIADEYHLLMSGTAGLASFPHDTRDYNELFTMIDKTLYRGKTKGRNCYIIYVPEKHKDIEIKKLRNNSLYEIFKNLAAAFDTSEDLYEKLKAGFESIKNDLHINNLYYSGGNYELKSVIGLHSLGSFDCIDCLISEDVYATNKISEIRSQCPKFYKILSKNEVEALLVMRISSGGQNYGYLMCAEPHTLRIWQENEYAVMLFFARMLGEYMRGRQLELE
ncbi:MAG: GGDEF domain-containing protein [Anaerolineaceae bacterium]|nr:GGDEF domain-containing protein [Anaerolineaceae bacterium]